MDDNTPYTVISTRLATLEDTVIPNGTSFDPSDYYENLKNIIPDITRLIGAIFNAKVRLYESEETRPEPKIIYPFLKILQKETEKYNIRLYQDLSPDNTFNRINLNEFQEVENYIKQLDENGSNVSISYLEYIQEICSFSWLKQIKTEYKKIPETD